MKKKINEEFLWAAFREGKQWALARIFEIYYQHIYYYGLNFGISNEEVKDLIQDLFFKLWKNKSGLSRSDKIKPYLIKSFRGLIIDYFRTSKKRNIIPDKKTDNWNFEISHEDVILKNENERIVSEKIKRSILKLSQREQEVIYLRFYEELDYQRISEIMSLKYQSVRNLIHVSLKKIRKTYDEN